MKKRVLAILLAATMLLSENSAVFAAEEILNAPVQANVLEEMENPEDVSADNEETEEFPQEDFTESQPSGEEISRNSLDSATDDLEGPIISTNDMGETENPETKSADIIEQEDEPENPQAIDILEPQAAAASEDVTADFKDPNFQAAVRDELGLEEDEPITKTDCEDVSYLTIDNQGIKNLAGIEHFINLWILDCSNNQLTGLKLENCPELTNLHCNDNQLTSLDVSRCPKLLGLNCENNLLTALDVSHCLELDELSCRNNRLSSLDVSHCPDLLYLYCEENQLTSLDVSRCPKLDSLYCDKNQLTALDMDKCTKLKSLHCSNNKIASLELTKHPGLDHLYLNCNELATLKLGDCPALKTLNCNDNSLTDIQLGDCPALTELNCYNNKLKELPTDKCPALENLSCSKNNLNKLEIENFSALKKIYCDNNQIKDFKIDNCKNLTWLACSNNPIEELNIKNCSALEYLDCTGNGLKKLDAGDFPSLKQLTCHSNNLTSLDVNNCPELQILICNANLLTSLNIDACPALNSVNCAFNQLTKLNIECASLTLLECTDNKLSSLNLSGCPKLQTLSCGHNQISSLDLEKCPDLDQLFCRNNKLTKLDVSKCAKLRYIDCRDNYMKSEANVTGRNSQLTGNVFVFDPQKGTAAQTLTVTFDKNSSKASLAANKRTKKVTKGKTYGALPTPSWSGYYFQGWYTARSGGKKVTSATAVSPQKNHTLYAHWIKADLTKASIKVKNCTWNGKAQKPAVTVKWQGMTLKSGKDYTLSYSNNKNPGKGKVTVRGKGVFSRSKSRTVYFTISKATQTITAKNATYKTSDKGRTITLKVSVKGGAKLTYASNKNNQIRVLNKNSSKLKLMSPGAATITIKAAETKYYKAATKKVTVVLQGTQSITLTSKLLNYNKTTKTYMLGKEISEKSIGVSVKGGAKYVCSVTNSGNTSAWFHNGDKMTARGRGNITVTVQAEKTKDGVYPALKKSFTIYVNGFQMTSEWSYQQSNNGTLTLMKYYGSASKVTIPNTLTLNMETFAVTALGDSVFENLPVQKVTIQEGTVLTIGKAAFKNCSSLSEVQLNSKTTSIGEEAFYGCSSLKSISLPEGLKTLPAGCLKGCSALEGDLYLPEKLTSIGTGAFEGCGNVRNFIIHSFLANVGDNAFKNCGNVRKVYFAGPRVRWNGIRIGAGNDALNGTTLCCNAGGASGSYSFNDITDESLFYTYPGYLTNEGYDKITGNLEGEMLHIMASHTEAEEVAAALKSEMINGPGYYLSMLLTDSKDTPTRAEQKMNRALALELLMEEAELAPIQDPAFQEIYSVIETFKEFGDQIFTNGDTRYQLAMRLDGLFAGRQASEINDMLKLIDGGDGKRWDNISAVFDGLDAGSKAADYLMTFITLVKIGNDSLNRLYYRLPKDSGLYNGIAQLRDYLNQPLTVLILDFITDKALNKCVKEFQKEVFSDMFKHKGYTTSHYIYAATMIYKLIGTMMDCPTIDSYNNAWLSIGNARVLRNEIQTVRQELTAAAQKGVCDENLRKDYDLLMRTYLLCLKKAGGYVASTMTDPNASPEALNARMARYQSTLDYDSYLIACKSQIN